MVFVDVVDAFMVVSSLGWVVFNWLVVENKLWVVLLEFCAADTLLKFNISVNPNNKSSVKSNFCLILKAP
jgi:hypothetical protein